LKITGNHEHCRRVKLARAITALVSAFMLLLPMPARSQGSSWTFKADSLNQVLKAKLPDSSRINALVALSQVYQLKDNRKALAAAQEAYEISKKIGSKKSMASSCYSLGYCHEYLSEYDKSLAFFKQAYDLYEELGMKMEMGMTLNGIGVVYSDRGDYARALDAQLKSIQLYEEIKDMRNVSSNYHNIGKIYHHQKNFDKAQEYFNKAIAQYEVTNNKSYLANSLSGLGSVYVAKKDYARGEECFLKALEIKKALNDKKGISSALNNLAVVNFQTGRPEKTLEYFLQSMALKDEMGDKSGVVLTMGNIGSLYNHMNQPEKAVEYYDRAIALAKVINDKDELMEMYLNIASTYETLNEPAKALENYKLHLAIKDSIFNFQNSRQIAEMQTKYDTERKEKEILMLTTEKEIQHLLAVKQKAELANQESKLREQTLLNELREDEIYRQRLTLESNEKKVELLKKNEQVQNLELKKKQIQVYSFSAGLALLFLLSVVVLRGYRQKQKANRKLAEQNEKIALQKALIEDKNKDIVDSIQYAKRIQDAILPPENLVRRFLPDSFILYRPKDIVAGDFYWMDVKDGLVLFAAADCTGHGVPGAMVSVVCSNALNRTVKEFGITDPGKILDKVRELVIQTFEKSESEVKDGMDISLCALDKASGQLLWAGANSPLWIVSEGQLNEIKPDKQPVGVGVASKSFSTHKVEVRKGDLVYLFTDGFADQFGGAEGKKFKSANLKKLVMAVHEQPVELQRQALLASFEAWKGPLEQVDDVCIIGVRI
jgi:serine phosphatase RsbU (regulator of sigma subunit)/tetratricopeptide (TPR) repeat protein